jgi:hypothetical protein
MQFAHPFTAIVAGPTGSGKTQLVKNILLNAQRMITPPPDRIVWYYSEWQTSLADELQELNIEWRRGAPSLSDFDEDSGINTVAIVDDQMDEADKSVADMFTKGSHHRNVSVIFLVQNFFDKKQRTASLNAQYIIFFKNPRSKSQFSYLARDMYPNEWKFLVDAYIDATAQAHGYLLMDLKQTTNEFMRCISGILPNDTMSIYVSKKMASSTAFREFSRQ